MTDLGLTQHLAEMKRRLADLQARLPAHSIPATLLLEMEEVEDELLRLRGLVHNDNASCISPNLDVK